MNITFCTQDSKNLLELCHGGSFEEVKSLLRSKDKGAAVNATFEEVYVCHKYMCICIYHCCRSDDILYVLWYAGGEIRTHAGL